MKGGEALASPKTERLLKTSPGKILAACLAFTFLNPHVYLDTVVLLGSISTQYAGSDRWLFALGAYSASILWFSALGFGAKRLQPFFRKPRAWQLLDGFIALVMFSIAIALASNPLAV